MQPKMSNERFQIIKSIGTPLGFFVLALLIVEGFLTTILIFAKLSTDLKIAAMLSGIILFILVVSAVFLLVWFKPRHLTFDKEAHLIDEGKIPFGTEQEMINPAKRFNQKKLEEVDA